MPAWSDALAAAAAASACPVCLTDTGEAVRDGIFTSGFVPNVAIALAPLILAGLLAELVAGRVAGGSGEKPRRGR
jgi:hypothetical protein